MRCILAFALAALLFPSVAPACGSFGRDDSAVGKVQSSWGPAERLMAHGEYAKALKELQATAQFLPSIHDASTRACVAEGANIRIVAARAGAAYLSQHPTET